MAGEKTKQIGARNRQTRNKSHNKPLKKATNVATLAFLSAVILMDEIFYSVRLLH